MWYRLLFASLLFATTANADVQFVHTPPTDRELPEPGKPMTLSVVMPRDVVNVGMKVRAIITRDQRLMEVQDTEPTFDASDRAVYRISVAAPLAEMSYQFIFSDRTGTSHGSRRYALARPCVPNVELTKAAASSSAITKEEAIRLVNDAKGLERDIALYDQANAIIDSMRKLVPQK